MHNLDFYRGMDFYGGHNLYRRRSERWPAWVRDALEREYGRGAAEPREPATPREPR